MSDTNVFICNPDRKYYLFVNNSLSISNNSNNPQRNRNDQAKFHPPIVVILCAGHKR